VDLDVAPAAIPLAVPAFLLQPLIENAVRHGSALEAPDSRILVRISVAGATLDLTVENDAESVSSGDVSFGTGLSTTRDRLGLLYGDAQRFDIARSEDRFLVHIAIPARTPTTNQTVAPPVPALAPTARRLEPSGSERPRACPRGDAPAACAF
jgi:LytS/YehU family sensor histidine kinase